MRNITDEKIREVEKIVRDDFAEMLLDSNISDFIEMQAVFGLYASNHERFKFLPGEKSLIDQIVLHVRSFEQKDNNPSNEHFNMPQKYKLGKKNLCCTPIGYLFGNKLISRSTDSNNHELNGMPFRDDLICKLNSLLVTFEVTASDEMILMRNNERKAWADVSCVLCTMKNVKKTIRVQFDESKLTKKTYWNLSNFSKHLRSMHDDGKQNEIKERKIKKPLKRKSTSYDCLNDDEQMDCSESIKKKVEEETEDGDEKQTDSMDVIAVKIEGTTSMTHEFVVTSANLASHIQESIYSQLSDQNLKLTQNLQ